jgi:hypothetical protein
MWRLHLEPDSAGLVCVNNAQGCWIVAQRVWVPLYKISLAEMIVEYKEKVNENATFLATMQKTPGQGKSNGLYKNGVDRGPVCSRSGRWG